MAPLGSAALLAALFAACILSAAAGAMAASPPPAPSELSVLQSIKVGLDPTGSVLSSWQPTNSCSTWLGLTCDIYGHVTSMNFGPSVIFTGALHSVIGSLPYLSTLFVRTDGFMAGSTIPSSISKLSNLTTLVLSGFDRTAVPIYDGYISSLAGGPGLSGSLPAVIAALPVLTYLDLSNNNLTGVLPSFASAKKLAHLDLSGNRYIYPGRFGFEGPASTFSTSNSLTFLNLATNGFTTAGNLSVLTKLEYLNLGGNEFSAFDGASITSPTLKYLNLSSNNLEGDYPDLAHVTSLQSLDLSANGYLTTTLRADYGNLTNLQLLNLTDVFPPLVIDRQGPFPTAHSARSNPTAQNMELSTSQEGPIPASYGNLINLRALSISPFWGGDVDDAFPPFLGELHNLRSLTISGANLYSYPSQPPRLPAVLGNLTGLQELKAYDFGGNESTGAYPSNLVNLQNLTSLTMSSIGYYFFTGNLPKFVPSLKLLQKLDLSQNQWSGPVWPNLGVLTQLNYIDLSIGTSFTGHVPLTLNGTIADVLSAGPSWRYVNLVSTGLTGPVPANIGSLKNLQYLAIGPASNGSLPSSLSQLTQLQYLSLPASGTGGFSGIVPDLSATELTYLDLSGNSFTGAFPKLPTTLQQLFAGGNLFTSFPDGIFTGLNQLLIANLNGAAQAVSTVSASLFSLPKLLSLSASNLGLKAIPTNIGPLPALIHLDLSDNNIAQPLPTGIQSLPNLNELYLSNNRFTGSIPDLSAVPLVILLANNNSFTGSLPRLGVLGNTDDAYGRQLFDFSFNKFTSVPSAYFANLLVFTFIISHNQLTGPLPALPMTLGPSNSLDFSHNAFSGTPPPDYLDNPVYSIDLSFNQLSGPPPNIHNALYAEQYPAVLGNNYFTGQPVYLDTSTGNTACIGFDQYTSNNCFTFAGTYCQVTPQKLPAQCTAFCGDTSASGPCAGHGVCSLNGSVPTCACNPGYTRPPTRVSTCVASGGTAPPPPKSTPPDAVKTASSSNKGASRQGGRRWTRGAPKHSSMAVPPEGGQVWRP